MREVAVLGGGMTRFGKLDQDLIALLTEASLKALGDSNTVNQAFDCVFVGNMASGELNGKSGIANSLVSELALVPAFASKMENTSASGGSALLAGWLSVASGYSDLTLVVGGEKMTNVTTEKATDVIASLTHDTEYMHGVTLLSFAGLMARYYLMKYGAPRESLAKIAVKNHHNGALNPCAQFQKEITLEQALNSPMIADPLRLYDFCPISDGAAALVLAPLEIASKFVEKPVKISGIAGATDYLVVHEREDLTTMKVAKIASEKAYRMAGLRPDDIDVAELHDMATILEVVMSEDLGFFEKGQGWKAADDGDTCLTGKIPINTSGGLKAKGHPLGATGVAQIVELTHQIQGKCGRRQVPASSGLACNMGGFGNSALVTILEEV